MKIRVMVGDITKLNDVEAIVNAANGVGPMGSGVAGAIGYAGGPNLRNDVRRTCELSGGFDAGECYISESGDLGTQGIKNVYHAVTMKYPGSPTSTDVVREAMRNTLETAIRNRVETIAFPGLGTGVGQLSKERVAVDMADLAQQYSDSIGITIIDLDKEFIDFVKGRIQVEDEPS
jgi:O-acetyl-ADP-ribose deacetylase (regulator of RNase III)